MSYRGQYNPARPDTGDQRAALAAELAAERAAERRGLLVPSRPAPAGSAGERFDVHELLRREADYVRPPPDQRGVSDQYVVLDSFAKDATRSNPGAGQFAWNFSIQGSTGRGAVGVRDRIDRVTEVQISPFALPVPPQIPYPVPTVHVPPSIPDVGVLQINTTPAGALIPGAYALALRATNSVTLATATSAPFFSQIACGGRFTIQLVEAGLQSFSSLAGTRYHFDMVAQDHVPVGAGGDGANGIGDVGVPGFPFAMPLAVSPLTNWDTYLFTDPLMDVHGLTLVLRNPDIPIQFQPDVLYQTTVNVVSSVKLVTDPAFPTGPPVVVNPVPPIPAPANPGGAWYPQAPGRYYLIFNYISHGLLSGDQIIVSGFNSGNPTLDAYVNRVQGHLVGTPIIQTAAGVVDVNPVAQGVALPTPDSFALDPMPDVTNLLFQYFVPATTQMFDASGAAIPGQFTQVLDGKGMPVLVGIPSYWMPPQVVNVYVLKRRIRIPIRFRRSVDRPTNDIVSVN